MPLQLFNDSVMAKTKDLKNFDFGNSTDVGLVRQENEDYMGYFECINGHVFVVCDGMGGHVGGAAASRIAVENIRAFLENHYFDMPEDALIAAIEFANSVVYKKSRENMELSGMGTTVVMAIVRSDKVYYAHVGDSRIYVFSEKKLYQLTRDHSYVQTLVDQGLIQASEAEQHPRKNEITRALGIGPDVEVEVGVSPVVPANDDVVLLCTDGLTGMLSDAEIEEVLCDTVSVQHKAMKLTQLANEKGGVDNITEQLILFYNVSNRKSKFVTANAEQKEIKSEKRKTQHPEREAREPKAPRESKVMNLPILKNLSADARRKLRMVVIILGVLFLAYIVWDLFIKESVNSNMVPVSKPTTTDSIQKHNKDSIATNNAPPAKPDTLWVSYSVKKGEVLGKIATKFGVPVSFIKFKNKLKNDNIGENQKLQIPIRADYTVAPNETLDAIAKRFKVEKASVMRANDIKDEKSVRAGRDLMIPIK